ncbi:MAG: hypothetical protein R2939_22120 [Kofleriaceae bacterium]
MTYRDDHEAALARAAALATEVERLEQERDELAAAKATAEAERDAARAGRLAPPRPRAEPTTTRRRPRPRPRTIVLAAVGVAGLAVLIAAGVSRTRAIDRAWATYEAAVDARTAARARWSAMVATEPCARDVDLELGMYRARLPATWSPEAVSALGDVARLVDRCRDGTKTLAADPLMPAPVRDAMAAWLAAEDALAPAVTALATYLRAGDWKEDAFARAPALVAALEAPLAARAAVLDRVHAEALPPVRAYLAELARAHAERAGHDLTWWRIELGLELWSLARTATAAGGLRAGRPLDTEAAVRALRQPMAAWRAHGAEAPIEVRRELRAFDWIADAFATDGPRPPDLVWQLCHGQLDVLRRVSADDSPMLPVVPPRPPDRDD